VPSSVAASGEPPTGAESLGDYAGRAPRLAALWLDRDVGLVRWAPVLLLVLFSVWLLWRARSQHLARVCGARRRRGGRRAVAARVRSGAAGGGVRRADAEPATGSRPATSSPPSRSRSASWPGGCGTRRARAPCSPRSRWAARCGSCLAFALGDAHGWVHPGVDAPYGPLLQLLPRF
jgi:hypothetical protein